jgi:hypothetical protein
LYLLGEIVFHAYILPPMYPSQTSHYDREARQFFSRLSRLLAG